VTQFVVGDGFRVPRRRLDWLSAAVGGCLAVSVIAIGQLLAGQTQWVYAALGGLLGAVLVWRIGRA